MAGRGSRIEFYLCRFADYASQRTLIPEQDFTFGIIWIDPPRNKPKLYIECRSSLLSMYFVAQPSMATNGRGKNSTFLPNLRSRSVIPAV